MGQSLKKFHILFIFLALLFVYGCGGESSQETQTGPSTIPTPIPAPSPLPDPVPAPSP
ncbi:MAG: hypothetical protein ACJAS9_003612, partial [Polaribacter sp.]